VASDNTLQVIAVQLGTAQPMMTQHARMVTGLCKCLLTIR